MLPFAGCLKRYTYTQHFSFGGKKREKQKRREKKEVEEKRQKVM